MSIISRRIQRLDLDPIKVKLMDNQEGEGWNRELVDTIEKQYRQFLHLISTTDYVIVPTRLIDKFWHIHILDTHKYAEDCENLFGRFIHHFPYFGMRGEEDKKNLHQTSKETLSRVDEMFGKGAWDAPGNNLEASVICTSCGTSDCAPDPSCASRLDSTISNILKINERPRIAA